MTWFGDVLRSAHRLSNSVGVLRNLWWLALVIGGSGFAAWRFGRSSGWCVVAGGSLAVLGLVTLAIGLVCVHRASIPQYTCESAEYEYGFDANDPRRQWQVASIRIRANRDDVALFRSRYYWSGQGESSLTALNGHHIVAEGAAMGSERRYYYVLMKKPLNRGERALIKIKQSFFDKERKFQPVLAKSLNDPVGRLTLRVSFPAGWEPGRVVSQELRPSRSPEVEWRTVREAKVDLEEAGETSQAAFTLDTPRVGRRYALSWEPWSKYYKSSN